MIYFVRDPAAGMVKIGYSANAWARLTKIQSDSPGKLIAEAVIEGEREDEAALHVAFAAQRVRGEWFAWDGPVATHVAGLKGIAQARPAGKRDPIQAEVTRVLRRMGYGTPYCSQLHRGARKWPLRIAVAVWKECGHKVGPISAAPDADILVLAKYAVLER